MERQLRKKKIITGIAVILLIAVYIMIFCFSADDGAASSSVSVKVTKWLMKLYYSFFNGSHPDIPVVPGVTDEAEAVVRKLAHFTEYMAVGLLSFGIITMWIKNTGKGIILVVLQLLISAGLDEIHQYFVPGRYSSLKDVMIDTAGGITGILVILCVKGIKKRWNHTQET
ncbi:MAG: VanZ family protein [Suilimivivens sp.]